MIFRQIFDMVDIGLVVLDPNLKVLHWNRWMELKSGISPDDIVGTSLFDHFPDLNNKAFLRSCKSVMAFGNFSFFSQKLHQYLFSFKAVTSLSSKFDQMQQSCTIGPLRDENKVIQNIYISVQDVTEVVTYEQKLLKINMKDDLTGIYNRRCLEMRLKEEVQRHKRYERTMGFIIFDIDFFKKVNDEYGHQCGDNVLKEVSSCVNTIVRDCDIFARYGGEEFCCILPETDLASSLQVAERIRKAVEELQTLFGDQEIKVTVSLGVSELNEEIDTLDKLLQIADQALYRAKKNGRNRTEAMSFGT